MTKEFFEELTFADLIDKHLRIVKFKPPLSSDDVCYLGLSESADIVVGI